MTSKFPLLILAFLPIPTQAQNASPSAASQQQAQSPTVLPQPPAPQGSALTDEQGRAWLLQSLQPKQVQPAMPIPAPSPTPVLSTAEQLALFERWLQSQKQPVAPPASIQTPAQTEAQALDKYQSCIAAERTKLTNAANGQQTPASVQNSINSNSTKLSQKTMGVFDLNAWLRQMQAAGIEAKAKKNCKALMPPATAASKQ